VRVRFPIPFVREFSIIVGSTLALIVLGLTIAAFNANAQEAPPSPDVSLLTLTCDDATQAALNEGLHVTQCRRYGVDTIEAYKAVVSVTVKTEQGKFIVTVHYYKSPWWISGLEVVRA
jgi:hypothetical protein